MNFGILLDVSRLKFNSFQFFFVLILFASVLSASEGKNFKIGVIGALSGSKAPYGISHLNGAILACEEVNKIGGIHGKQLFLVPVDDKGEMGQVGQLVTRLVFKEEVIAILGSVDSGCSHVISMITVKTQVPYFTCVATDPSLTRAGSPWTFRTLADDERQSETIIQFIKAQGSLEKIGIIAATSRYGRMGAKILEKKAKKAGLTVIGPQWIEENHELPLRAVSKILESKIDAIIIWALAREGKEIVSALHHKGFRGMKLGGDGLASPAFFEAKTPGIEGVLVTCPYDFDSPLMENEIFKKKYRERFGVFPDSFAAHAYDTVRLVAQALLISNGTRQGLRDAVYSTTPFAGVTGSIQLDKNGNDIRRVSLAICEKNRLRLIGEGN